MTSKTVTELAAALAKAVEKDEAPEIGGFDLSGGLFGPNVSGWLRSITEETERLQRGFKMDEARAREILDGSVKADDSLRGIEEFLYWMPKVDRDHATLDGTFTADELEAIAWWMKNK